MKKLLYFIPITLLIAGCSASYYQTKDLKKLDCLALQYPAQFAALANKLDPCFTPGTVKSDTTYLPGSVDTTYLPGKTVQGAPGKPDTIYLPSKKIVITNKTSVIHDTIPDNRALEVLQSKYQVKADSLLITKTQFSQSSKSGSMKTWWIIGLAIALVALIVISIYRFVTGGVIKDVI